MSWIREIAGPPPRALPEQTNLVLYRNAARIMLLLIAQFCFCRALSFGALSGEQPPVGVKAISTVVPLNVWVATWLVASAISLFAMIPCRPGGSVGCVIMCTVWAVGYTYSWVTSLFDPASTPGDMDYRFASSYWLIAGLLIGGYLFVRASLASAMSVRGSGGRAEE